MTYLFTKSLKYDTTEDRFKISNILDPRMFLSVRIVALSETLACFREIGDTVCKYLLKCFLFFQNFSFVSSHGGVLCELDGGMLSF